MPICGDLLSYTDHQAEYIIWKDSLQKKSLTCEMVCFQATKVKNKAVRTISLWGVRCALNTQ